MNNVVTHPLIHPVKTPGFYHLRGVTGWAQMASVVVCRSQAKVTKWRKLLLKILGATGIALWLLLLTACGKPDYKSNPRPILHTTISSDGQMVATLLNAGTDEQRVRVMRLDKTDGWQDVKAPRFTQSIQFGLSGKQLLLKHHVPELKQDRLVMLDLDKPGTGEVEIYRADKLGFPQQVSESEYIVRKCTYEKTKSNEVDCTMVSDHLWVLVQNGSQTMVLAPWEISLRYGRPNIIERGVFWLSHAPGIDKKLPHLVHAIALPGGEVPRTKKTIQMQDTSRLACDRQAERCLRYFISNWGRPGKEGFTYIFHVEAMYRDTRCLLEGVGGATDDISISPDGKSFVMSLADKYDSTRHVVVAKFADDKCEATSVQHIHF